MTELVKGDDLSKNKIDYIVNYRKINDSLFESVVKYPPGSTMIPEQIYSDTVVKGKTDRYCLYKRDKRGSILIRSRYRIKNEQIALIERYDLNNKLIQLYFPNGVEKIRREWTDSSIVEGQKILTYNIVTPDNEYKSTIIYNKFNIVIENAYSNISANGFKEVRKSNFFYDRNNNPIIKLTVDENNRLVNEERYYYDNKILTRYIKDNDFTNSVAEEEKIFDSTGKILFYSIRAKGKSLHGSIFITLQD